MKSARATKRKAATVPVETAAYDISVVTAAQPVSNVRWVPRSTLNPNDYNPNHVFAPEKELLVLSIIEDGWTQPIVVLPDMTIVDGFHRWMVSEDPRLVEKYRGFVPVAVIDVDTVHRKMSTIRHNRARGQHGVLPMAKIVQAMVAEGVAHEEVMRRLGMEKEEVVRLLDRAGMPERGARGAAGYGKEWVPTKDGTANTDKQAA